MFTSVSVYLPVSLSTHTMSTYDDVVHKFDNDKTKPLSKKYIVLGWIIILVDTMYFK